MAKFRKLVNSRRGIEVIPKEFKYGNYGIETIDADLDRGTSIEWHNHKLDGRIDNVEVSVYGDNGRGRMQMMQREERLHLWHLLVPP